ncbi:MAG: glycoside hydrolase family 9 protein [Planctomycetales bacterium]|nr:glycoside hydrolase family 9 protein [Planctomycetales bacterium]
MIRLNSVGYLPDAAKTALIAAACQRYAIENCRTGQIAMQGEVHPADATPANGQPLWRADFSELTEPGLYRFVVDDVGRSAPFSVSVGVYNRPFFAAMRGMTLWRCGVAVRDDSTGEEFHHAACHLGDGLLDYVDPSRAGARLDGAGGWHDAGDYNKYVVNGAFTVGMMLHAWLQFEDRLTTLELHLPDGQPDLPDVLEEAKWEIDWLLKMQAADGRVYHKLSTLQFGGFVMPEEETEPRYYAPWGSAATADLVAVAALASRVYRPYDAAFADRCLAAARLSDRWLQDHPNDHRPDQSAFHTGGYDAPDGDDRLWADAELWAATGDPRSLQALQHRLQHSRRAVADDWDWGDLANLGVYAYLTSDRADRDPHLVDSLQRELIASADRLVQRSQRHPYDRTLGDRYYWGCNGTLARQTMTLQLAHRLTGDGTYQATAQGTLAYLFGRNPYGRSFVTGVGAKPPRFPHDRRSGGDDVAAPWPGYLVGGPWPAGTDWRDEQADYRTNEIAINWNGALIYALAPFVEPASFAADTAPLPPPTEPPTQSTESESDSRNG